MFNERNYKFCHFLKFWIYSTTFVKNLKTFEDFVDFDSICHKKQNGTALNIRY